MSARILATGCALALSTSMLASLLAPCAEAAPRASTTKPGARRARPRPGANLAALAARPAPAAIAAPTPPLGPPAPSPAAASLAGPEPAPALALSAPLPLAPDADRTPAGESALAHRATVTLNPLALAIGRYGANAELVFARHHAVTASAYLQTFPQAILRRLLPDIALGEGPEARLGGEIGYRLYSGSDGPTGIFIGPSAIAMPLAAPRLASDYRAEVVSFMAYGASLDVGVQAVVGPGFTIGGGVGVMALAYSPPASATPPTGLELPSYPEPHVLPRLLFAAGWAF